ncbi:glycosyltransferase family 2 protein [Rufibacter immobilis]|uniref:glycosyltransferase family 2 protein n=1 Tax=Rufibacter immobilis TaxID=1348778 RepID=UPI0035E73832
MILLPLLLLVFLYAVVVLCCWYAWRKLPELTQQAEVPPVFFTVIIPVRNEASNILRLLQDLEQQRYPVNAFEVLVVDDHSQDATPLLVKQFQAQSALAVRLIELHHFPGKRQKKAAVEIGIQHASGSWIVCTDGDCRLPHGWLQAYNQMIHAQQPKMISGPVVYAPIDTLWQRLQALEFSALIGVGAASIALQKPTMCNGANLAYEKAAFEEVNGFAGNEQIPSGDDEFLLHKIHSRYPGKVVFLKSKAAIVQTPAAEKVRQFLHQRVRWASKWRHYQSWASSLLALLVLGANVAVLAVCLGCFNGIWPWYSFATVIFLKLGADAVLLRQILLFFEKKRLLSLLWLLQLVYVPYIVLTAILGLKGTYVWKGRQLKTT